MFVAQLLIAIGVFLGYVLSKSDESLLAIIQVAVHSASQVVLTAGPLYPMLFTVFVYAPIVLLAAVSLERQFPGLVRKLALPLIGAHLVNLVVILIYYPKLGSFELDRLPGTLATAYLRVGAALVIALVALGIILGFKALYQNMRGRQRLGAAV